jgi:hypothetical protein
LAEALLWGLVAGSSLAVGGALALSLPMPEAFAHGGRLVGLATTLGFAVAFGISALD